MRLTFNKKDSAKNNNMFNYRNKLHAKYTVKNPKVCNFFCQVQQKKFMQHK